MSQTVVGMVPAEYQQWLNTATAPQAIEASSMSDIAASKQIYDQYQHMGERERVEAIRADLGLCRMDALQYFYFGLALSIPEFALIIGKFNLTRVCTFNIIRALRRLQGNWKAPGAGKIKPSQVKFMMEVVETQNPADATMLEAVICKAVRENNKAYKAKIAAKQEEEAAKTRALYARDDFEVIEGNGEPQIVEDPVSEDNPMWEKNKHQVTFQMRKTTDNHYSLLMTGLSAQEMQIVTNALNTELSELPDNLRRLPKAERMGHAAMSALNRRIRGDKLYNRVRMNVVVNLDTLKEHPEAAITANGQTLTGTEVYELSSRWGLDEAFVVRNETGHVISYFKGRLSTEIHRIIWEILGGRCIMPFCNCQWGLESHHLHAVKDGGKTTIKNCRPVCPFHHREITNNPGRFFVFDKFCTALWIEPGSNRPKMDVYGTPGSTLMRALGKQYGYDTFVPEQFAELRRILLAETRKEIYKNHPELRRFYQTAA
ncbi:MAG: HNH endonuclease signature motif containing protein [Corynebacterium sp.]|nr:HNH endonuclease signature motif containing protein [Corynebacterium sp.]